MNTKNKIALLLVCVISLFNQTFAQNIDSLMAAESNTKKKDDYVYATFKGTKLINGHTVEIPKKHVLQFMIQHRFGVVSNGLYDMFGLDNAVIRLGLDYGVSEHFAFGIGRSSTQKAVDGYLKFKLLRQRESGMPVTMTLLVASAINTLRYSDTLQENTFIHRLCYSSQLLIARKFSNALSLQLMPTWVHLNLVPGATDHNDIFSMGIGGRIKLTKRFSLSAEYYYLIPNQISSIYVNALSFGFDIETGGHVFQIHFTNAPGMIENQFVTMTTDQWQKMGVRVGFNISRAFALGKKKHE